MKMTALTVNLAMRIPGIFHWPEGSVFHIGSVRSYDNTGTHSRCTADS